MLKARITVGQWTSNVCLLPDDVSVGVGDECIVAVDNTPEWAIIQEVADCAEGEQVPDVCRFVRPASPEDHATRRDLETREMEAVQRFRAVAEKQFPEIRPLCARYSFDGRSVTLFFRCEQKVEWGVIGRAMEEALRVRVELRQLGSRDEAAFLGGLGICGRRLCCSSWMRRFRSVNIRMARTQNLSLNPAAISGLCGRLKCCLRFEYDQYRESELRLPKIGARVCHGEEEGVVIARDLPREELVVRLPDRRVARGKAATFRPTGNGCRCAEPEKECESP